jgi:hypothetical protein
VAARTNPVLFEQIEALATAIARADTDPEIKELAHRIAEAQIDLCRVRHARYDLLSREMRDPWYESRASRRNKWALIRMILGTHPPDISEEDLTAYLCSTPRGPQKFGLILLEEVRQLRAFDRYERRALSRRKTAIGALDRARRNRSKLVNETTNSPTLC